MSDYDVIVIGSGAGGGTLVHRLAPSGKRILLLERGDWLPREPQNWLGRRRLRRRPLHLARHLVLRRRHAVPAAGPLLRRRARRSSTARRCTACARQDFGELRHVDGVSPAWPIGYDEMEPYYTHGRAALPGARRARRGPDRAAGERALPVPGGLARAAHPAALRRPRGGRPAPVPRAVRRPARRGEPALQRAACAARTATASRALVHAKSDAEVIGVRPALEHRNVDAAHRRRRPCGWSRPTRPGSEVTGVVVDHDGRQEELPRRPRRRRRAARRTAPGSCSRRRARPTRTGWPTARARSGATTCSTTARRCWRCRASPTRRCSRRRSGSTTSTSRATPGSTRWATSRWSASRRRRCSAASGPARRAWRPSWTLRDVAAHAVDFWLSTEDLPLPENRVTLRPRRADRHRYTATNDAAKKRLYQQLKSMLSHLGMHHDHLLGHHAYLKNEIPVAGVAHQAGTCRFGSDPATSVLNTDCRAHEVDNLYVVDTSFFPSIGAVNPALTAMANALRVGDHLLERLGRALVATGGGPCRLSTARHRRRRRLRRASAARAGSPSTTTCTSRCSTATTTTSSSRCCTRWRPRSWPPATSRSRCASCSSDDENVDVKLAEVASVDPATHTVDHGRRPDVSPATRSSWPPARSPTSSAPPGGAGARVPAVLARRRAAAALARSSASSRTPTATRRCSTRAR